MKTIEELVSLLSQNTINPEIVKKTLLEESVRNYRSLWDIQKSSLKIKRWDIKTSSLINIYRLPSEAYSTHAPKRFGIHLDFDTINYTNIKKYRSLKDVYRKELTQQDISNYADIFSINFLVFINGLLVPTATFMLDDSEFTFMLHIGNPGISFELYEDMLKNDTIITLISVPNYEITKAELNIHTLKKINYFIGKERFQNWESLDDSTLYFSNIDTSTNLLSGIYPVSKTQEYLQINDTIDFKEVKLNVIGITIPNLYEKLTICPDNIWFILKKGDYPLPTPSEHILLFQDGGTYYTFSKDTSIQTYYPNIYKVENVEDNMMACIWYDTDTNSPAYNNDLELLKYFGSDDDILKQYEQGQISDVVLKYEPLNIYSYLTRDNYYQSVFFPNNIRFSVQILDTLIKYDDTILLRYLFNKLREVNKYYIDMSKLNLFSRLRETTDIGADTIIPEDAITLSEPHYVFSVRKAFIGYKLISFRLFIDNIFYSATKYFIILGKDFYHFFIPSRLIKEDSIMEIEKYEEYGFDVAFIPHDEELLPFEIPKNIASFINIDDIAIYNTDTFTYLTENDYKVYAYNEIVDDVIELDKNGYSTITGELYIRITNRSLFDKKLMLSIHHNADTKTVTIKDTYNLEVIRINNHYNITNDKIRLFVNGLCMPKQAYRVVGLGQYNLDVSVLLGTPISKDDEITMDVIPYKYRLEYYQEEITDPYNLIDTKDALSFPFHLKWYDVYLNGRKLNKSNIEIISNNKFFIKGVSSKKNLYIYIKSNVSHEYVLTAHDDYITNQMYQNIENLQDMIIKDKDIIEDTLSDIITGIITEGLDHYEFIIDFLRYSFINPNIKQISDEIKEKFPSYFDKNNILWLDTNTNVKDAVVTLFNSNERSKVMVNGKYRYGFTPLHIGSHEDARIEEYLCDPVTGSPAKKNADGSIIASGYLDRLATHRDTFTNKLKMMGLGYISIYQLETNNNNSGVLIVEKNVNLFDETVDLSGDFIEKMVISLDIDVLKVGYQNIMTHSDYIPTFKLIYSTDPSKETEMMTGTIDYLSSTICELKSSNVELLHLSLVQPKEDEEIPTDIKIILHSILIAF